MPDRTNIHDRYPSSKQYNRPLHKDKSGLSWHDARDWSKYNESTNDENTMFCPICKQAATIDASKIIMNCSRCERQTCRKCNKLWVDLSHHAFCSIKQYQPWTPSDDSVSDTSAEFDGDPGDETVRCLFSQIKPLGSAPVPACNPLTNKSGEMCYAENPVSGRNEGQSLIRHAGAFYTDKDVDTITLYSHPNPISEVRSDGTRVHRIDIYEVDSVPNNNSPLDRQEATRQANTLERQRQDSWRARGLSALQVELALNEESFPSLDSVDFNYGRTTAHNQLTNQTNPSTGESAATIYSRQQQYGSYGNSNSHGFPMYGSTMTSNPGYIDHSTYSYNPQTGYAPNTYSIPSYNPYYINPKNPQLVNQYWQTVNSPSQPPVNTYGLPGDRAVHAANRCERMANINSRPLAPI